MKSACLSAVLVMGLQVGSLTPPTAGTQDPLQASYFGFTFAPGGCERGLADCVLRKPKSWTADEIETVKQAIDAIAATPTGKTVIARSQRRGYHTLRRYVFSGMRSSSGVLVMPPGAEAQLHRDSYVTMIDINDPFFARRGHRDEFSGNPGYLLTAEILLHECFHAIDDVSKSADFVKLVGFVQAGAQLRFAAASEADVSALTQFDEQLKRLAPLDDLKGLWRANRKLALGMHPVRVPSMMSVRSPAEAFAEIGSHLILDPRARKYLSPQITAFFDKHVFTEPAVGSP